MSSAPARLRTVDSRIRLVAPDSIFSKVETWIFAFFANSDCLRLGGFGSSEEGHPNYDGANKAVQCWSNACMDKKNMDLPEFACEFRSDSGTI